MPTRDIGNNSVASRENRIMELAVWDWRRKPSWSEESSFPTISYVKWFGCG